MHHFANAVGVNGVRTKRGLGILFFLCVFLGGFRQSLPRPSPQIEFQLPSPPPLRPCRFSVGEFEWRVVRDEKRATRLDLEISAASCSGKPFQHRLVPRECFLRQISDLSTCFRKQNVCLFGDSLTRQVYSDILARWPPLREEFDDARRVFESAYPTFNLTYLPILPKFNFPEFLKIGCSLLLFGNPGAHLHSAAIAHKYFLAARLNLDKLDMPLYALDWPPAHFEGPYGENFQKIRNPQVPCPSDVEWASVKDFYARKELLEIIGPAAQMIEITEFSAAKVLSVYHPQNNSVHKLVRDCRHWCMGTVVSYWTDLILQSMCLPSAL